VPTGDQLRRTPRGESLKLVIFDCDGVLVESEPIAIRIDMQILARFGMHLSEAEVVARYVGRSPSVMQTEIEEHLGEPLSDAWQQEYRHLFTEAYDAGLEPVSGITQALDQIAEATCVASSSEPESLIHKLKLTGLHDRFAGRIFSAAEVRNGKPAPDLFLHAAERMAVAPSRCAVVEDSRYGVEAARAAGMSAFAYAGGVTSADVLRGPGTTVFEDMRELPGLLRGFGSARPS
jgi:HAD superfamily hydrolase (TIGR01509 family)